MKSSLQKTEPMSSAKEYERKISKVVNDTAAQQHIAEQASAMKSYGRRLIYMRLD